MSNLPEGLAQFEYQKMQLIGSLGAVAETMRNCAAIAEQFAQLVSHVPYNAAPMHPNGQFLMAAPPAPAAAGSKRKARAGDEEAGGRKKRARKPKDPNAPKRPPSSYLLFQNEVRQQLKAKNPNLPNNELLNIIAKLWSEMPKEEKDAYEERQKQAKEVYLANKVAYEAHQIPPVPEAALAAAIEKPVPEAAPAPIAAPPAVTSPSSDESSSEQESSSEESADEETARAAKKAKKTAQLPAAPAKAPELPREKKSKKVKA